MDLTNRTALVTGGAGGVGRGIALALAEHGADVVVADLVLEHAEAVAGEVEEKGRRALVCAVDVTEQESVDRMVNQTLGRFEDVDILVNGAGVIGGTGWEQREENAEEDWDMTFAVNLKGVVRVTTAVKGHMKQRRYGKIVNISSIGGRLGNAANPAYNASKAGVISFTQSSTLELAPYDINVNTICPGPVWTPMWERIAHRELAFAADAEGMSPRELFDRRVARGVPLGRAPTAEDIGHLAAFLASDYARNITGQAINVSGGEFMD